MYKNQAAEEYLARAEEYFYRIGVAEDLAEFIDSDEIQGIVNQCLIALTQTIMIRCNEQPAKNKSICRQLAFKYLQDAVGNRITDNFKMQLFGALSKPVIACPENDPLAKRILLQKCNNREMNRVGNDWLKKRIIYFDNSLTSNISFAVAT